MGALMEKFELPNGWEWRTLGGVNDTQPACEFLDYKRKPVNAQERAKRIGPYPYYGANGQQGWIDDYIFDEELVLLAEDGGFFYDKFRATSYRVSGKCWVNNHAHVLRPKSDVHVDWLNFYLAYVVDYTEFIPEPNRPKLNQGNARKILIPIPPLEEQKRIVARIEELTRRVEEARRLRKEAIKEAEKYLPAEIAKILQNGNNGRWEWKRIRSVVEPKEIWSFNKSPREFIQYVDISSIDNQTGKIILENVKKIRADVAPSRAKNIIRAGDVIFATTRPYLRNIAIVPRSLEGQICSTGFCVLRPIATNVSTKWLYYISRSNLVVEQVIPNQEKSTYPAVSDDEVLDSEIPVPTLKEQQSIINYLDTIESKTTLLKLSQKESEQELERFVPALLAKAFRGEL